MEIRLTPRVSHALHEVARLDKGKYVVAGSDLAATIAALEEESGEEVEIVRDNPRAYRMSA